MTLQQSVRRITTVIAFHLLACTVQAHTIEAVDIRAAGDSAVDITLRFTREAPAPSREFLLQQPTRLAVDFDDTTDATGLTGAIEGSGLVTRIRLVNAERRTRLLLDLTSEAAYTLQRHGTILRLHLHPADPARQAPGLPAISAIDVQRGAAGEGRITLTLPATAPQTLSTGDIQLRQLGQRLVADINGLSLPAHLQRKQQAEHDGTPVNSVTALPTERGMRLVIEARGLWRYRTQRIGQQFTIEILPAVPAANVPVASAGTPSIYRGEKLSMHFQSVDVRAALQVLADFTGLNIVAADTVSGQLSLRLKDVPWDQALDIILQARNLGLRRNGDVLWIAPREEIMAREKQALEQQAMIADLEPLQAEVFQLNYQRADIFRKAFGLADDGSGAERRNGILSRRGSAVVDARTNQLFVTDTSAVLANVRALVERIDIAARQVLIEARIVEADDSFGRELGVRLGLSAQAGRAAIGNNYGAVGEQTGQTGASATPGSSAVNLPAQALGGATPGSFALTLFNAAARRFLNVELSALESQGKGKIVASPRVVTADQQAALIEQGEEIPYQQSTSSGATATAFKKANLKLEVTPQITPDGNVVLSVDVNKDSRGTATPGGLAINTKHVRTQVQVEDGGTVVIGGIYTLTESEQENKVPLLGDIPVLGALFRHRAQLRDKTELLIFLTPRIVARDGAAAF